MDPPLESPQEKSPLSSPYLTVKSHSKLMHLLLVMNSAKHIGVHLTTGGFEFKILVIDRQTTNTFVNSVIPYDDDLNHPAN